MSTNKSEQTERRAVVKNDTLAPSTYHALANLDTSLSGRFGKADIVTGDEASARYFELPTSSPWGGPRMPDEPSLGLDINAPEPNGTFAEIQASISSLEITASEDGAAAPAADPAVERPRRY
jgi:hypothetical protein